MRYQRHSIKYDNTASVCNAQVFRKKKGRARDRVYLDMVRSYLILSKSR